jgi:hypothetical protein
MSAARHSARVPLRTLAEGVRVSTRKARAWETGAAPLYCVQYRQLREIAVVLERAHARGASLHELVRASQCDLFLAGVLTGTEDYADLPALETGEYAHRVRQLLRWALVGEPPKPYARWARPRPLLPEPDVRQLFAVAASLERGDHGTDLTSYGTALLECFQSTKDTALGRSRLLLTVIRKRKTSMY